MRRTMPVLLGGAILLTLHANDRITMVENGVITNVPATPELIEQLRKAGGEATILPDANLIMSGGGGSAFNLEIPGILRSKPEPPKATTNPGDSAQPQTNPTPPDTPKKEREKSRSTTS